MCMWAPYTYKSIFVLVFCYIWIFQNQETFEYYFWLRRCAFHACHQSRSDFIVLFTTLIVPLQTFFVICGVREKWLVWLWIHNGLKVIVGCPLPHREGFFSSQTGPPLCVCVVSLCCFCFFKFLICLDLIKVLLTLAWFCNVSFARLNPWHVLMGILANHVYIFVVAVIFSIFLIAFKNQYFVMLAICLRNISLEWIEQCTQWWERSADCTKLCQCSKPLEFCCYIYLWNGTTSVHNSNCDNQQEAQLMPGGLMGEAGLLLIVCGYKKGNDKGVLTESNPTALLPAVFPRNCLGVVCNFCFYLGSAVIATLNVKCSHTPAHACKLHLES